MKEVVTALWYALYMTFDDDNYLHCESAFLNSGLDSEKEIEESDRWWIREGKKHGCSNRQIEDSYEYIKKMTEREMGRRLSDTEEEKIKDIIFQT